MKKRHTSYLSKQGCGKSEFLKQIRAAFVAFDDESVLIDGSYGSKAGISKYSERDDLNMYY